MRFEYLVVPFIGTAKKGWFAEQGPQNAGAELQNLLNYHAQDRWEFMQVETITIQRSAGCLVGFFLRKQDDRIEFHQVVFRRPVAVH